ncbi:ABC transporter ATP-binding protein [Corynebacterium uropygiale]|uniref:ABC transporter ATP-binding protein n=1 Tax=Corynebacterium uropygiale TaxID=1775911 RepID=A0A9X1QQ54_9CORY|nr:ABC transporter ATP-binding protein [Corynebacterium uropygiale]MCF4006160.1 ABC transporter ATP-binding protein [Corynebacterium uropygiale]
MTTSTPPTLSVSGLSIPGILDDVSFDIGPGERVGLIGESGSGKSLTALSVTRLLPENLDARGTIRLAGEELPRSDAAMQKLRGTRVAMVFQEPMTALDPLMKASDQILEALHVHGVHGAEASRRARSLWEDVGLREDRWHAYPHQLSGGQRQRVLIAMALAHDPDLLICDEPTTALDVTVQKHIVDLILTLVERKGTGLLFITHDLGLVQRTCEKVVVMQRGRIVETGPTETVLRDPQHEYTRSLVAHSQPRISPPRSTEDAPVVLRAEGLRKVHPRPARRGGPVTALDGVDLELRRGARLGIVGESGSGKSSLLRLLAGLDTPTEGRVESEGQRIHMVFQDPMSSLDPRMRVESIVGEPLRGQRLSRAERRERVREVLHAVGIGDDALRRFPHEFSGGQRQRISIARALALQPDILLADEPVSALDVTVRSTIIELLEKLCEDFDLSLVFVSHDLTVTRYLCEEMLIMRQGRVIERGPSEELMRHPSSDYARELIAAVPTLRG